MIKKYFISNIFIVLLLNLLVKPIWIFFIDRKVQLTVGHEVYGLYGAFVGLTLIFNIILDFGITNYNNKSVAADTGLIEKNLPNMLLAKILLSFVYFLVIFLVTFLLHYDKNALMLVGSIGVIQMLNSFLLFLRSNVSANHHFKTDSLLSVLDKLIMIIICGYFLYFSDKQSQFKIEWFIMIQVVAYLLAISYSVFIITRRYTKIHYSHISVEKILNVSKSSIPYALLILFMAIYMRSDTLMLERISGAEQNSLYLEAYRVLDASNMIAYLFAVVLLPMFSRMLSKKLNIESLVVITSNIMISFSLAMAAFCVVYAEEITTLLYPKDASFDLTFIFQWVMGSFPAFCIMYIYSTLLTANDNIKLLTKIAFVGSLFSIVLNSFMIHYFEAKGAAITCFVIEWGVGIAYIIYCVRILKISTGVLRVFKFLTVFVAVLLFNYFLKYLNVNLLVTIPFNGLFFIGLVYIIRLWDRKYIETYLKLLKLNN
ncbi:MAG TPA: oligosaccharide flippase family protein [Chitinophagaceae bacterium]|nr:MAG: polysaccharide biosynthesis protein [Bacteroidetes bacterium OLB11]HMN32462.1 oligosaccharide flippase family protein [Chitinophagaceae bacterium]